MLKVEQLSHLPISQKAFVAENLIRLAPRETLTLKQKGQSICVQSGLVWITLDDRDHFVGRGEAFHIGHGKSKVVISSANKFPIQIEIQKI